MAGRRLGRVLARSLAVLAVLFSVAAIADADPSSRQQSEASALSHFDFGADPALQWRLPDRLREISGLAMTPDGRLLAHDDERAVVYEIDYAEGELAKAFAMGDPTARDDFEGIAVVDERIFLVSSGGRLYESAEGADGERVLYNTYGTGVGKNCEVEGLAFEPNDRTLIMVCKTTDGDELEDSIVLYRWSLEERAITADSPILIDRDAVTDAIPGKSFHPSGIERHSTAGTYFVVAAREEAMAELNLAGDVLGVAELEGRANRQVEGITFTAGGDLLLASEGGGGRARLSLYRPVPN